MLIKTRGIVFRTVKYSETSFIIDIYTEEKGLQSYIISGVRSKKAKVSAGLLQVMSLVDIVAYYREGKELNRIKEIKAAYIFQSIPFNVVKSSVGMFMIELAQKTIKEAESNPGLFDFLFSAFSGLDKTEHSVKNYHLQYMIELSAYLGFLPAENYSEETPVFNLMEGSFESLESSGLHRIETPLSTLLFVLMSSDLAHCHQVEMTRQERRQLVRALLTFYRLHVEQLPPLNAYEILETVLE